MASPVLQGPHKRFVGVHVRCLNYFVQLALKMSYIPLKLFCTNEAMLVSSVQAVKSTIIFISRLGPAESLFQESYYELMKKALKPDGVLCCQGKCNIFICKIDAMYASTGQGRVIVISYIHATRECQSSIRCKKTTKRIGNHCLINTIC